MLCGACAPGPANKQLVPIRSPLFRADPTTRLFAFRSGDSEKQYLVGVNRQNRGHQEQIRALQVSDIWGEPSPTSCCPIAAGLAWEYDEQIDVIVFRCLNQAQQRALTA